MSATSGVCCRVENRPTNPTVCADIALGQACLIRRHSSYFGATQDIFSCRGKPITILYLSAEIIDAVAVYG